MSMSKTVYSEDIYNGSTVLDIFEFTGDKILHSVNHPDPSIYRDRVEITEKEYFDLVNWDCAIIELNPDPAEKPTLKKRRQGCRRCSDQHFTENCERSY